MQLYYMQGKKIFYVIKRHINYKIICISYSKNIIKKVLPLCFIVLVYNFIIRKKTFEKGVKFSGYLCKGLPKHNFYIKIYLNNIRI